MEIERSLGAALKWLRSQRGWPQKQLAAEAGVTRAMVSSYEKGKQRPTLSTIDKLMTALDADLCDLHCAFEHLAGRPMTAHDLSPKFQYGHSRSQPASRQLGSGTHDRAGEVHERSTVQGEPPSPEDREYPPAGDLERALSEAVTGFHRLLRYALLGK